MRCGGQVGYCKDRHQALLCALVVGLHRTGITPPAAPAWDLFPRVERRRHMVLNLHALRRTAANRIDVASRLSVRTTAACRLFPSGEALPSTTSAGSCLPLFGRFLGTTASSDFSSAYILGVRLLPSRSCPARLRARVRPPRFRAKNFSTFTRSPTARGSSHASQYAMEDVAFSSAVRDRHLGIRPVSQLNTRPVVSPVNASRLPSRAEPRASLGVGAVG